MNNSKGLKKDGIFNKCWILLSAITIFYSFYFQYGIKEISGLMIALCGLLIAFALVQILAHQHGRIVRSNMMEFLVSVILSVVITIVVTSHGLYGTDVGIRMIEYVLASYSIYLLIVKCPHYLELILWTICITISLLACTALIKGVQVSSSGAVGLANVNSNSMSSYFLIMMFCSFFLLYKKREKAKIVLIVVMQIITGISQIIIASRRGFIVLVIFIFLGVTFCIIPYKSKSNSRKRFLLYMFLILAALMMLLVVQDYILNNTVLGARLLGEYDNGDLARARYQAFALESFKKHPILGIGVGAIAHYMGAYSHSMYYEIFSCTGIFLALYFLIGLVRLGIDFWISRKRICVKEKNKAWTYISNVCLAFWLCLIISGIAVVMIYDFHFYFSVALLAAIVKIVKMSSRKEYDFI